MLLGVVTTAGRLSAQAVRTQDVGFSAIKFDSLPLLGALSLNESIVRERERSSTSADGVLSLFDDGRWSMQGALVGARYSPAIPTSGAIAPWFRSIRGEFAAGTAATAQQGSMPTVEVVGTARAHLLDLERGAWGGASVLRSFDGEFWRTTLAGDVGGWVRHGATVITGSAKPLQTTGGDLLTDLESSAQWTHGGIGWQASGGYRAGVSTTSRVAWLGVAATFLVGHRYLVTASAGNYPQDLVQGLPGGRYLGLSMRLPARASTRPVAPSTRPPTESGPDAPLPSAWARAVVAFVDTPDSGSTLRLLRVRAPGAQRVEVSGDFTSWQAVSLARGRLSYWEMTIRVGKGTHRFNVRVDGREWIVPANVARVRDEFSGDVGVVVVP